MDVIAQLAGAAFLVESLTDAIKRGLPNKEETFNSSYLMAMVLGILVALYTGANIFTVLQFNSALPEPYAGILGSILTGILFGRGGNYFADFWTNFGNIVKR